MSSVLTLSVVCACLEMAAATFTDAIEVRQGRVRGLRSLSGHHRYYGIPYAVSKRFQPPEEPPKWKGVYTAVNRLRHCAQTVSLLTLTNEDCLHLDVYTPGAPRPPTRWPVLVFIHGGGYYYGTKAHYDPEFLVTKNVVVVIINYRLGIFGFLCANGVSNLGLKDQVAALKWIKKNIAAFGGDPDNVTISGQSAGASSAAMHFLSKASAGLFHKAILMSGAATTPWAFNVEPLKPTLEDVRKIGRAKTEQDIYNILTNSSVEDILAACADVSTNPRYFKYSPCVDTDANDPFFHDTPYDTIKSGKFNKVPMIIGFTNKEGMLFYGLHDDKTLKDLNDNFVENLPSLFSWQPDDMKRRLGKKIQNHYFGAKRINREAVRGIVSYYSDWVAYGSMEAFTELMVKYSDQPVFSYIFAYEGSRNFAKFIFGSSTGLEGASHSDDIFYMFKPGGLSLPLSIQDSLFIDRFTTMITDFMKFSDPTPKKTKLMSVKWPARSSNESRALRLDRRLKLQPVTGALQGAFMRAMLCAHALPGYAACDNSTSRLHMR